MTDQNFMRRMAPFLVLEILKKYTDEEHGLKASQIVELMEKDYGININRKSVSSILNDLLELSEIPQEYDWKNPMPFSIKFDVIPRSNGDIRENWRLCKEFEDGEIRLLTDLVKAVPGYPHRRLYEKLQRLGSPLWKSGPQMPATLYSYRQMPATVDCIDKAIRSGRKISFHCIFAPEEENGERTVYTVSPYMTAFYKGNYYLVGYDDTRANMACFRIGVILDAQIVDAPAKDYHSVSSLAQWNFRLDHYLRHIVALHDADKTD